MKSRTRGPRHLNLGLTPLNGATQGTTAGQTSDSRSADARTDVSASGEDIYRAKPERVAAVEENDTSTLILSEADKIEIPTFLTAGYRHVKPTEPTVDALFEIGGYERAKHRPDFADIETGSAHSEQSPLNADLSATFDTPPLDPELLSQEMSMTDPTSADNTPPGETTAGQPQDHAPEAAQEAAQDAFEEAFEDAPKSPSSQKVDLFGTDKDPFVSSEPEDETLFADAPPLRGKVGGEDTISEIRLDEPSVTPPPRTSAPVMASATGRSSKSRSRQSPASPPARSGSRAVARPNAPGTVLQLSSSSGVTYWGTTGLVSLTWVAGLVAASVGSETGLAVLAFTPFKLALLVLLAVLPLGLIFATAYALRHASRLAVESARAAAMADALVAPAAAAASDTAGLVTALREQVEQAVSAVRQAHAEMTEMGSKLQAQTELLHLAAQRTQATTQSMASTFAGEREAMSRIGESLDAQAQGVVAAVDRQARMVADASDLAQAQLREAEASLTSRATDFSVAASEIQETARIVSEDLGRQTQRLESAGAGVADQIKIVEEGLSQQRAGLVSAALSLRADQEDFAVHLESQRSQLGDALSVTRGAMVELGDASSRGIDLLREIVISAQDQLRQVLATAENERTSFETRIHSTLDNISVMAADARDGMVAETQAALEALNLAAEDSRKAAESAATAAQTRVERLNEALFESGKKADEVFDSRMHAAQRLIEDSAALIDEAGARTAGKLDEGFLRTRDTIRDVTDALQGLNAQAESLPSLAQARIAEIRQAVEDGIRAMTEAARQAAQETEAVDQSFQERVRRNYDMLSEAVRMMGLLSGPTPQATAPASSAPRERLRDAAPRLPETPAKEAARGIDYPRPEASQPSETRSRRAALSEPYTQSQPAKSVPPQLNTPQPPAAGRGDHWSWSDLLKGIEGRGEGERSEAAAFDNLDDLMISEISGMGIDAASLLGRTRMDETIAAILAEDNEGARLAVRRIAPAAVRRLTRRFVSDTRIRDLASQFIAFYDRQINVALLSSDARVKLHEILANDTGRAYLLIDAAISDII